MRPTPDTLCDCGHRCADHDLRYVCNAYLNADPLDERRCPCQVFRVNGKAVTTNDEA